MTRQRPDFSYGISDERLLAYGRIPVLDRLRWLDEIRRFTLLVRNAPLSPDSKVDQDKSPKAAQ